VTTLAARSTNKNSPLFRALLIVMALVTIAGIALGIDVGLFFLVLTTYVLGASLFSVWRIISSLVGVSEDDGTLETQAVRRRKELVARRDIKLKIVEELKFDHALGRISNVDFEAMHAPVAREFLQAAENVQKEETEHRGVVEAELSRRLRAEGLGASVADTTEKPEVKKSPKVKEKAKLTIAACASCEKDIDPDSVFCKHCGHRQTGKSGDA
jgi:hypothetical protein